MKEDTGNQIPDSGYRILDTGSLMLGINERKCCDTEVRSIPAI